jgi:hypothetical protein
MTESVFSDSLPGHFWNWIKRGNKEPISLAHQAGCYISERVQRRFQVFDDLLRKDIRRRHFIQVIQAVVLQPENIQAGLVAGNEVVVRKVLEALRLIAFVPIVGVVAGDEIPQVVEFQRLGLEGEVCLLVRRS